MVLYDYFAPILKTKASKEQYYGDSLNTLNSLLLIISFFIYFFSISDGLFSKVSCTLNVAESLIQSS